MSKELLWCDSCLKGRETERGRIQGDVCPNCGHDILRVVVISYSANDSLWTQELPTTTGYYWYFDPTRHEKHRLFLLFVNVEAGSTQVFGGGWASLTMHRPGYWLRIVQPLPPSVKQESEEAPHE